MLRFGGSAARPHEEQGRKKRRPATLAPQEPSQLSGREGAQLKLEGEEKGSCMDGDVAEGGGGGSNGGRGRESKAEDGEDDDVTICWSALLVKIILYPALESCRSRSVRRKQEKPSSRMLA